MTSAVWSRQWNRSSMPDSTLKKTRGSMARPFTMAFWAYRPSRSRGCGEGIELAAAEGTIVGDEIGGYQAFGCAVMEKFLSSRFQNSHRI